MAQHRTYRIVLPNVPGWSLLYFPLLLQKCFARVCLYLLEVEKELPAINTPVRAVSCKSLHHPNYKYTLEVTIQNRTAWTGALFTLLLSLENPNGLP